MTTASRRGRQIADLFRQSRGLTDTRACNLEAILEEAELEVVTSRQSDPGYAAVLVRLQGGGAGIMVADTRSAGRRRFSLAHELGHFFIPTHARAGPTLRCADADLRARSNDSAVREWEANDFAAELLMPRVLFAADAKHHPICFETVELLAHEDRFAVSRTAAAWRLVQTTREACAFVVSTEGAIDWVARSAAFTHWIPERGQPISHASVAAAVRRGEAPALRPEQVDPSVWFESPHADADSLEVSESAVYDRTRRQTMSLIWVQHSEAEDGTE